MVRYPKSNHVRLDVRPRFPFQEVDGGESSRVQSGQDCSDNRQTLGWRQFRLERIE